MIALDTNVLVRFVTRDDAVQWKRVNAFLEKNCTRDEPGWIANIVLCETIWVLSRGYGYRKKHIVAFLNQLLITADLEIEQRDATKAAVDDYATGSADFSDYLIGRLNVANGCTYTATLDRQAAKHATFKLLK